MRTVGRVYPEEDGRRPPPGVKAADLRESVDAAACATASGNQSDRPHSANTGGGRANVVKRPSGAGKRGAKSVYLTYDEYKSMGGTAEEPAFTRLCTAACGRIDRLTHGRVRDLEQVPQEVKAAVFELIHRAESYEAEDARMASFTNDGMSVSYVQETAPQRDSSLNGVVIDLLWGLKAADGKTPLLYAGVAG